jgi:hypothetical protein
MAAQLFILFSESYFTKQEGQGAMHPACVEEACSFGSGVSFLSELFRSEPQFF